MNFNLWILLEGEWVDGKYHLQKLLGAGGFGGVFLANEVVADEAIAQVAVKLIQVDAGNQNTQLKELIAARQFKHPNLLHGFTCGLTAVKNIPLLYLVMELGEEPLNKRLEKGVLSPESAREVTQDIASALAYLHGEPRKMVHRDLKPANVLRVGECWQLSDFGLVRVVGSKSATNTTQMLGTPNYAPPESYDGIISPAWDVWSLGVLLVEALAGKMPFTGDTPQQLQNAVTNAPPQLPSNLPAPFDVIVPGCLEKDRERRLTAVQILDILSSPPPPKTQPVESLCGYFILPELALQGMVRRLGRGWIRNVIPLNQELVLVCAGGGAALFNMSSGEVLWEIDCPANCGALNPDGTLLALGGARDIYLWDLRSGQFLRRFSGHQNSVSSVAFSPDGKILASGSSDKTVRLWDVATGSELRQLSGHENEVYSVAFSPDGKILMSGSSDRTVRLWDVATGSELRQLSGHGNSVCSVAFSPHGKILASGSEDHTVRLWNVASGNKVASRNSVWQFLSNVIFGEQLQTLSGHRNWVWIVAFSPDGKILASGSWDKTVRLWDVATGKKLRQLSGHENLVSGVAFSPDGKILMSGSEDGTVRLWAVGSL